MREVPVHPISIIDTFYVTNDIYRYEVVLIFLYVLGVCGIICEKKPVLLCFV